MSIQVATVFSGIGAFEQALIDSNITHNIVFACDIDKFCKKAYLHNYKVDKFYDNIEDIKGSDYTGKVDILVGGSPCQSFSIAGKREGMEDPRGQLIHTFIKLLEDIKPKQFIFENVKGLKTFSNGEVFNWLRRKFREIGYKISTRIISSRVDLGFPQSRERIFIVGDIETRPSLSQIQSVDQSTLVDYLDRCVDDKYNIMNPKWQSWIFKSILLTKSKMAINGDYIICQTARQYASWHGHYVIVYKKNANFPYIQEAIDYITNNKIIPFFSPVDEEINPITDSILRRLTPTETLRLMGFKDANYKNICSDSQCYKQCGNSIIVPMLNAILSILQ